MVNYAEGAGGALLRADGTIVPLPYPLASYVDSENDSRPVLESNIVNGLIRLEYVTGHQELRTLDDPHRIIDLHLNIDTVFFSASGSYVIVYYRDGRVYVVDSGLTRSPNTASTPLSPSDIITFICDGPLKSEFWTPQDEADLASILQGKPAQACN